MNDGQNPFGSMAVAERNQPPAVRGGEMASTAAAAQAQAMINARYGMAMRNPRVWDQVRIDLMKECKRPSFANNKSALYNKPIGKGVEGLGIRFVEVALRCMMNTYNDAQLIHRDDEIEVVRVCVTDLESNTSWPMDVVIERWVERSKPASDGSYISVRKNSFGKDVFKVPATDDDLLNKRNALVSKALRTAGLRIIPGDLQDEAEEVIRAIRLDAAAKDPDAERRKLADAFAGMGVSPGDLIEYLGHGLDGCTPAELVDLRGLYGALKDGESTWLSVMENKRSLAEQSAGRPPAPEPKTGTAALKAVAEKGAPKKEPASDPNLDKSTGETISLLDRVKQICQAATELAEDNVAFLRLQDAGLLLMEMNADTKALAVAEIDAATAKIKARSKK